MDCGCEIRYSGGSAYVDFCALHGSAEQMLEALEQIQIQASQTNSYACLWCHSYSGHKSGCPAAIVAPAIVIAAGRKIYASPERQAEQFEIRR